MYENKDRLRYTSVLTCLVICALLLVARLAYLYIADPVRFPINTIKIMGAYQHVPRQQLESILEKYSAASFISFPVRRLYSELFALPWIEQVQIERLWPDTLKIHLTEKKPVAIWNNAFITEEGKLFNGEASTLSQENLPQLVGPVNQQQEVLQVYKKLSKILTIYSLSAVKLQWRENAAWELTLSNGLQLRLGKRDLERKITRFCKAYPAVFGNIIDKLEQPISVDLRYPRGMAVKWKNKREDNG